MSARVRFAVDSTLVVEMSIDVFPMCSKSCFQAISWLVVDAIVPSSHRKGARN